MESETTSLITNDNRVPWFGFRYLMTLLLFLGCAVSYSHRVALSIGIVAMVDKNNSNPDYEEFDWDSTTQNTILSSFFWGYIVCQIPAGLIAQALGAKILLFSGVAISSVATFLTPIVASNLGWEGVCGLRVIEGLSQGALYPSMHAVIAKWGPPDERGKMASVAFAGGQLGTIITLALGGVLAEGSGGWPSIYYVFGGAGIAWCVVWFILASSYPKDNRFMSAAEKKFIQENLSENEQKTSLRTPWLAIATSIPMWAILLAHSSQNWGYWTLMTEMPTYMKTVLEFDIKSNGVLSALPYLVMGILSFIFGYIADKIVSKGWISLAWSRKLFNSIGFWGPSVALACLGYIDKEQVALAVTLLVLAVGLNAGVYLGFQVNHIDLSPNFASTMIGITNGIANILSIVGPLVVGVVVTEEGSSEQWRTIFWIAASIYFAGNIIFLIMADGVIQPWNDPDYLKKNTDIEISNQNETATSDR